MMTLMLEACASTSPSTQAPTTSKIVIETAILTRTVEVLPSATATVPPPTETPLAGALPPFTPGPPTSTPVLIAFTPAPSECVHSTESATLMQACLGGCVYWVDEYSDEIGFRIELSYLNNGEYFLYDVPANTVAFALPSEAAPRLDESREQCLRQNTYQVLVYALFAQAPPVIVNGMAFNGGCGQGE